MADGVKTDVKNPELIIKVPVQEFNDLQRTSGGHVRIVDDGDGVVTKKDEMTTTPGFQGTLNPDEVLRDMCETRVPESTSFEVDPKAMDLLKEKGFIVKAHTVNGRTYHTIYKVDNVFGGSQRFLDSFGGFDVSKDACHYNRGAARITVGKEPDTIVLTFEDSRGRTEGTLNLKTYDYSERVLE